MADDGDGEDLTFGLYLNLGANLAPTAEGVFALTERQACLGEDLGYHDLWVTEHHFIRFGINPSALMTAGYLLGRTERIRVGTAVTLSPLCHPVALAERAALLDQLGGAEGTADPDLTVTSIERFAAEVAPQLTSAS